MNADEISRLAAAGNAMRPDWPVNSLRTFLETNLAWRAYGDTAVALAWIATKTGTETPKLLLDSKCPGWKAALVDDPNVGQRRPPRAEEECRQHRGEYAPPLCRCCHADRKARADEETAVQAEQRRRTKDELIAAARAQLRQATTTEETS